MIENYWVKDNTIIFKPKFNEPIDNYIGEIFKYNGLIFSNYNSIYLKIQMNMC